MELTVRVMEPLDYFRSANGLSQGYTKSGFEFPIRQDSRCGTDLTIPGHFKYGHACAAVENGSERCPLRVQPFVSYVIIGFYRGTGAACLATSDMFRSSRACAANCGVLMDPSPDRQLVTQLLQQWGGGDKQALEQLMPVVYEQLRQLAANCLRAERPDHTLRATALVHEAYLRLVDSDVAWQDRVHFYAVSARLLRRILVDHAKSRKRYKRGREFQKVPL